jgi:hypothetical protein
VSTLDKKKNESNIKKSSSMFLSKTKRAAYDETKETKPSVGTYNQTANTIQESVRRNAEVGIGNPLLANLKAKKGGAAPFSTGEERFKAKKRDDCDAFLGPGYYESKTFVELEMTRPSGKSQGFLTNQSRFKS